MSPEEKADIAISWLIFLGELAAGILVLILLYKLSRIIRALSKRYTAAKKLKKYCKENGYRFIKNGNLMHSFFKVTDKPELIVETNDKRYVIKLFTTIGRSLQLHFINGCAYRYEKIFGYSLPVRANWLNQAWLFKPKEMELTTFNYYHTEIMNFPRGARVLPEIKFYDYDKPGNETVPVLLLNPVPMKVTGVVTNKSVSLAGGDFYDYFRIHSASSLIADIEHDRIFGNVARKKIMGFE